MLENSRNIILNTLGVREVADQGMYLGLPSMIGCSKQTVFNFLREKMASKILGWGRKKMSQSGKE